MKLGAANLKGGHMSNTNKTTTAVIRGNEYIMPQAVKPNIASRPKPAPVSSK
jgi:hypothetical protein